MNIQLYHGDNLAALRAMPDNSVDAVVTDPPYGLGKQPDALAMLADWMETGHHEVGGSGFMGKKWDAFVPQPVLWREVYRVLKPGGHVLAFAGTRTQDLMALGLRLAGFEIRDLVGWLYGCLSDDTEILTDNGWEQYRISKKKSIFASQKILVYDADKDTYHWEVPERWNEYTVDKDTAYRITSGATEQIVSRAHRCLVERNGKLVFVKAEALKHQEALPFLESVPPVRDGFSSAHKRAGFKESFLQHRLRLGSAYRPQKETASTNEELLALRQDVPTDAPIPKQTAGVLLQTMQRERARQRVGRARAQRALVLDRGQQKGFSRQDDRAEQSGLERRRDIHESQGEVCDPVNKARALPERVCTHGKKRRVCDRVPLSGCGCDRQTVNADGMRASHKPRCNGQQAGKLNAVCEQQRPQEVRVRASYQTTLATVEPIEYSGVIFCPTVSTGAFVARRNGKIFITGNSGFPKSHDIGKGIDKAAGAEREVLMERKMTQGGGSSLQIRTGNRREVEANITAPATDAAKQWQGWGTALKPALEPITLARKPLEGTVVANVLKWHTGGLNVDGCRVGTEDNLNGGAYSLSVDGKSQNEVFGKYYKKPGMYEQPQGRWPANIILDGSDEVVGLFPGTAAGKASKRGADRNGNVYGTYGLADTVRGHNDDAGSAARFFYHAKASKRDRNSGLLAGELNKHPTVKPCELMKYLCRLVTPPGGIVLDPYMGSGTTGVAAITEGFGFIGMELEEESYNTAQTRIQDAVTRCSDHVPAQEETDNEGQLKLWT